MDHPLYDNKNKKVIGKFKDELNSVPLQEFAGCLPKCYSLRYTGKVEKNQYKDNELHEKATAKATKKCVREKALTHDVFRSVILDNAIIKVKQNTIQSKGHKLGTYHQRRTALTPYDTKRWIHANNITTRAIGHHLNTPADVISSDILWGEEITTDDINLTTGGTLGTANELIESIDWGCDIDINDLREGGKYKGD